MKPFLTIKSFCELYSLSEAVVRKWIFQKKIPYYKLGHQIRFDPNEIEKWVLAQRVSPSALKSSFQNVGGGNE